MQERQGEELEILFQVRDSLGCEAGGSPLVSWDILSSRTLWLVGIQEPERRATSKHKVGEYLLRGPISELQPSPKPWGLSYDVSKSNSCLVTPLDTSHPRGRARSLGPETDEKESDLYLIIELLTDSHHRNQPEPGKNRGLTCKCYHKLLIIAEKRWKREHEKRPHRQVPSGFDIVR